MPKIKNNLYQSLIFDKIKLCLKRAPVVLVRYAFLSSLVCVFISLALGGFIFYKYYIAAQTSKSLISEEPIKFKEDVCQEVSEGQKVRQKTFKEVESKEYPNPFERPTTKEVSPE